MLLGHVGVALAAKRAAPKAPLGVLLAASEALDLLCFGLVAAGIEQIQWTPPKRTADHPESASSYPWSHGLLMSGVWSAAAAAVATRLYRDRRTGGVIGLVAFSHWLLDFVAHAPDLPVLFDGSPRVGLSLEYSSDGDVHWPQALGAEVALLAAGLAIYRATPSWRTADRPARPGAGRKSEER